MRQHKSKSGPENLLRPLQVQKLTKNLRLLNIYVKVLCFSCIAHGSKTYGMGRRLATYHSTHYLTFRKQGLKKIDTFALKRRRVTIFICQLSDIPHLFSIYMIYFSSLPGCILLCPRQTSSGIVRAEFRHAFWPLTTSVTEI